MSARIAAGSMLVSWVRVGFAVALLVMAEAGGIGEDDFHYGGTGRGHRPPGRRVAGPSQVGLGPGRGILVTARASGVWENSPRSRTAW